MAVVDRRTSSKKMCTIIFCVVDICVVDYGALRNLIAHVYSILSAIQH
jgi:hypothetical protein